MSRRLYPVSAFSSLGVLRVPGLEPGVVHGDGPVEPYGGAVRPDSRTVYVTSHGPNGGETARSRDDSGASVVIDASEASIRRATRVVPNAVPLGFGGLR